MGVMSIPYGEARGGSGATEHRRLACSHTFESNPVTARTVVINAIFATRTALCPPVRENFATSFGIRSDRETE